MGETYLIVNPAKRQYLDIGQFNENNKVSGLMGIATRLQSRLWSATLRQCDTETSP